jgi:hypothetical protein
VHILTTRPAGDLPAPGVIYRMTCRWREETTSATAAPTSPPAPRLLRHHPRRPAPAGPEPDEEDRRRCSNGSEERGRQSRGWPGGRSSPTLRSPAPGTSTTITNKMLGATWRRTHEAVGPGDCSLSVTRPSFREGPLARVLLGGRLPSPGPHRHR